MSESSRARSLVACVVVLFALTVGVAPPAGAFTFEQIGGFVFGEESSTDGPQTGIAFFNSIGTPPDTWGTMGWGNQSGASFTTSTDPFTQTGPGLEDRRSALRLDTFSGVINPGDTVIISEL
ncbi:MAG TPA: hypothetical protein VML54_08995, partial [Candidatus Limnocylindrales bacterium]|nr:hypothetical protein [Candidatus Limnocylindrales bacterium]